MKRLFFAFLLLSLFVSAGAAAAQQFTPTTIPPSVSVDKPFIWLVSTPPLAEPSRVSWEIYGGTSPLIGEFQKMGSSSRWYCYFSNDQTATCGKSPVTGVGTSDRSGRIVVSSQSFNAANDTVVKVSSLDMDSQAVISGNNVTGILTIRGGSYLPNQITAAYTVYSASDLAAVQGSAGAAAYDVSKGYVASVELNPGKYFIAFDVTTNDNKKGGTVSYFEVGGTAIAQPGSQNNIAADAASLDKTINANESFSVSFGVSNSGSKNVTGLAGNLPLSVSQYAQLSFPVSTMQAGGSANYTLTFSNIQNSIRLAGLFNITAIFSDGNRSTIQVPLDIKVDVTESSPIVTVPVTSEDRPVLDVSPTLLSSTGVLIGDRFSDKIIVKNIGRSNLTITGFDVKGVPKDIVKLQLPARPLNFGEQANVLVNITPSSSQPYMGSIVVKSNGGNREFSVSFEAFDDITTDMDALGARIDSRISNITKLGFTDSEARSLFSSASSDLDSAKTSWSAKDYRAAKGLYSLADAKTTAVESVLYLGRKPAGGNGGEGLPFWIIIAAAVAVVALAAFIVIRKRRGSASAETGLPEGEYGEVGEESGEGA